MPDHSQQPIVSDLNAAPLSEYDKQLAQNEMTRNTNRARLTDKISHNKALDQRPTTEEFAPLSLESSAPESKNTSSEAAMMQPQNTAENIAPELSAEQVAQRQTAQTKVQQSNDRSDRLNSLSPLRTAGQGLSLINNRKITLIQNNLKKKIDEREKLLKAIKKLKRKILWQRVRIILEAGTGIGVGGALIEGEKYLEKKDKIKKDTKAVKELDSEISQLETEEYNLSNIFKRQNAESYGQNNPPQTA